MREEEALKLFLGQQASLEAFCMSLRITKEECKKYAEDILTEWRLQGKEHTSVKDAREHLVYALRTRATFERTNKTKQNDSIERNGQDKRRAAEVTATCASSYEGDF